MLCRLALLAVALFPVVHSLPALSGLRDEFYALPEQCLVNSQLVPQPGPSAAATPAPRANYGGWILGAEIMDAHPTEHWYAATTTDASGLAAALRFVPRSQISMQTLERWVGTIKSLTDNNVVQLMDVFFNDPDFYVIVRQATPGGPLLTGLPEKGYGERVASRWMRQMVEALMVVHKHQVIHGKVTPASFHFGDVQRDPATTPLLLGSFTSAYKESQPQDSRGRCGHPAYTSPSLFLPEVTRPSLKANDVYGLGGSIYTLFTGRMPRVGEDVVYRWRDVPEDWVSAECRNFVDEMMLSDEKKRLRSELLLSHVCVRKYL